MSLSSFRFKWPQHIVWMGDLSGHGIFTEQEAWSMLSRFFRYVGQWKLGFFKVAAPLCHVCWFFKALRGSRPSDKHINYRLTSSDFSLLQGNIKSTSHSSVYLPTRKSNATFICARHDKPNSFRESQQRERLQQIFSFLSHKTHEWPPRGNLINITMEEVQQRRPSVKRRNDTSASFRKQRSPSRFDI